MSTLTVKREGDLRNRTLTIDVPSEFADNARAYDRTSRERLALVIANACTLDVWEVWFIKTKRGLRNIGFTAVLRLAR